MHEAKARVGAWVLIGAVLSLSSGCSEDEDGAPTVTAGGASAVVGGAAGRAATAGKAGSSATAGRNAGGTAGLGSSSGGRAGRSNGKAGQTGQTGGSGATSGDGGSATGGSGTGGSGTGGSGGWPDSPPPLADCPDPSPEDAPVAYYVCDCADGAADDCEAGNDGANGTSATSPFRSLNKLTSTFNGLPPGGIVSLCRGGSWDGGVRLNNNKCRAEEPCVMRDYGDESLPKPLLNAEEDGFAIALDDPANANHEEGYSFLNLDLRGTGTSDQGGGVFVYNDVDDVLLCGLTITHHYEGVYVGGLNTRDPDSDGKNERTIIRNSYFTRNSGFGFLGGCDGCSIEYSIFDDNGFGEAIFDHNIYVNSAGDHMRVVGNKLYNNAKIDGTCQAVSLVVHGVHDDLLIEGNELVEEPDAATGNCWGIAVDPGYGGEAEGFTNVVIRGNTVVNLGNAPITIESCQDCLIENNVIINTSTSNNAGGISAPAHEDHDDNDLDMARVTIRNNTIFFGPNNDGVGIALGTEGTGHSSVNNVVSYAGDARRCFNYNLPASAYTAIDYNLCHSNGDGDWSSKSLAQMRADGFEEHSLEADPQFTSVSSSGYDLSPQEGSPLIDAGNPDGEASAPNDITGKERDDQPDMGAYEN